VGGSLGTAIIAVVLQGKITDLGAHPTPTLLAGAFGHTYWWVMGITLVALVPAFILWTIKRQSRRAPAEPAAPGELALEAA